MAAGTGTGGRTSGIMPGSCQGFSSREDVALSGGSRRRPRAGQHVGLVNPVSPVALPLACEGKPLHRGRGLARLGGVWVPGPSPLACFRSNVKVSSTVMVLLKSSIVCVVFQ